MFAFKKIVYELSPNQAVLGITASIAMEVSPKSPASAAGAQGESSSEESQEVQPKARFC